MHTQTHTWMHTSLVPADCGWNATVVRFCPEAKEDTSLVHLCQNQFRPVSQPGRRRQTDRPCCPALFSLSLSRLSPARLLSSSSSVFQASEEETERTSNLGAQDNAEKRKKKRGSVGRKRETNGCSRKQGGKRRETCLVVVGALLLMGQHELNTTAAIVF